MIPEHSDALDQAPPADHADVKKWAERVEQARRFDEDARKQIAKDRRYARGDSAYEVDANLVGTNIDILESFLYARDPDFDVTPGPACQPPSDDALREAASMSLPPVPAPVEQVLGAIGPAAEPLGQQLLATAIDVEVAKLKEGFAKQKREIKAFCDTSEILGTRMWQDAALKRRGRPFVRSALTTGVGVMKASWQERTAPSPETAQAINDLQANIAKARALQEEIDAGDAPDSAVPELERQLTALQGQAERVVARGYVIDVVQPEDFAIAEGFSLANHLDAPWNAHRLFLRYEDAVAELGPHCAQYAADPTAPNAGAEVLKSATRYYPRKPENVRTTASVEPTQLDAKDADGFTTSADPGQVEGQGKGFVALWEVWDRDTSTVLTYVEGVRCWVKAPWTAPATTRFYPFFLLCLSDVDGQRWPQSLVTRTMKLVDEYNRIGSAEAEHRRRILPKTAFDQGQVSPATAKKLERGGVQEMVGIELTGAARLIGDVLMPVPYAGLDPALYDRERIITEIERVWGVQEALSGAVNVAKTATEADIQQQGFQARSSSRRDLLESVLSDLARYTIEIARVFMDSKDAQAIAGTSAFWPPYGGPEDVTKLVNIEIRAGSSGKPNTAAEREAWSTTLPLYQQAILQIGQLRGVSPLALADAMEQLLRITAERAGDRIDIDQLIPQESDAMPAVPGAPVQPPAGEPQPGAPAPPDPSALPVAA